MSYYSYRYPVRNIAQLEKSMANIISNNLYAHVPYSLFTVTFDVKRFISLRLRKTEVSCSTSS